MHKKVLHFPAAVLLLTVPTGGVGDYSDEGYSSETESYSSSDEGRPGLSRRSDPGHAAHPHAGVGQWPERPPERETGTMALTVQQLTADVLNSERLLHSVYTTL